MPHMTHNYMLGLAALLISFGITFYLPIAYFWFKVRQQRKQNKQWGSLLLYKTRAFIDKT